jgi:hypothetical protein
MIQSSDTTRRSDRISHLRHLLIGLRFPSTDTCRDPVVIEQLCRASHVACWIQAYLAIAMHEAMRLCFAILLLRHY